MDWWVSALGAWFGKKHFGSFVAKNKVFSWGLFAVGTVAAVAVLAFVP